MMYCLDGHPISQESLDHSGILGMKWGIRRYQNRDGTLTDEGYERYYGHPRDKKQDDEPTGERTKLQKVKDGVKQAAKLVNDTVVAKKLEDEDARAAERERIIARGTAEEVTSILDTLSDQERRAVIQRLNEEDRIRQVATNEITFKSKQAPTDEKSRHIQKIVDTGKVSEVMKYSKEMTPEQRQRALQRLQNEQQLKDLAKRNKITLADVTNKIKAGRDFIDLFKEKEQEMKPDHFESSNMANKMLKDMIKADPQFFTVTKDLTGKQTVQINTEAVNSSIDLIKTLQNLENMAAGKSASGKK